MLTTYLTAVLTRELRVLSREIRSFPDDDALWQTPPGVTNSAGTLALHLTGNLQHFVGANLGDSGYRRNRPEEFPKRTSNPPAQTGGLSIHQQGTGLLLKTKGLLSDERMELLDSFRHSGFSADASPTVWPQDTQGLERLYRYLLRCPVSLSRMHWTPGSNTLFYGSKSSHDDPLFSHPKGETLDIGSTSPTL